MYFLLSFSLAVVFAFALILTFLSLTHCRILGMDSVQNIGIIQFGDLGSPWLEIFEIEYYYKESL